MKLFPLSVLVLGLSASMQVLAVGQAIDESRDVSKSQHISLEVMRGEVNIQAVAKNQFKVVGTLDEQAEGYELTSSGNNTTFKVKMPKRLFGGSWGDGNKEGSKLTIEVPTGAHVEFTGVNANVQANGIQGGTELTTVNGRIVAEQLAGQVHLETVNGEITSKANQGHLKLESVNGQIHDESTGESLEISTVNGEVKSSSQAKELEVSTVNGEVNLNLNGSERVEFSTVNGELTLTLAGTKAPRISGSSVSGEMNLTLPEVDSVRVSVEAAAGGGITNQLTQDPVHKAKYGPSRSLEFVLGSGEGRIELETVSGDITLKR